MHIVDTIPGIRSKDEQSPMERKALALEYLDEMYPSHVWTQVFTDGSAENAIKNGGGGIYMKEKNGQEICTAIATGSLSTNYRAEAEAIRHAIKELQNANVNTISPQKSKKN